ncbi:MAG: helix-turn-helix transcriptional regulator [Peptostreptococcaceae bacterium]
MRLLEIVFYLLRCNSKVTLKELASMYNVSTKTIQRDLDKLSILGIPIIVYRGKNGGVEIDKNYIIARYILKYSDYESLMLALYIGENISESIHDSYIIDKFKLVGPKGSSNVLDKYKERLVVDLFEEKIDLKGEILKEIDKAIDNKYFLKVELANSNLKVFPIKYVLRKEGLCLYSYKNEYLLIPIDEILKANIVEESYDGDTIDYIDNKDNVRFIDN